MIIPCIDLMDGKVVQLVQGREKVLEGKSLDEMLDLFAGFPQIQVIDLDAALGRGSNGELPTCPVDPQNSFSTSYTCNNVGTSPACLIVATSHVLP